MESERQMKLDKMLRRLLKDSLLSALTDLYDEIFSNRFVSVATKSGLSAIFFIVCK